MTETESKSSLPETGNQRVQLGIGTLIVIALIVSMCSGRSEVEKVQRDTARLKQQLEVIDQKLDTLVSKSIATSLGNVETPAAPADAVEAPLTTSRSPGANPQ